MSDIIDFTPYNKICVIGAPGVGKTFFARSLATSLGWPFIQFDEVRFGPRRSGGNQNSPAVCARHLGQILKINSRWVCEGTAWQPWTEKALKQADLVVVLRHGAMRRVWRIVWRWLRDNRYRRNWASTWGLVRISLAFDRERLPIILGRCVRGVPVLVVRPSHRDNRRHQWRVDA